VPSVLDCCLLATGSPRKQGQNGQRRSQYSVLVVTLLHAAWGRRRSFFDVRGGACAAPGSGCDRRPPREWLLGRHTTGVAAVGREMGQEGRFLRTSGSEDVSELAGLVWGESESLAIRGDDCGPGRGVIGSAAPPHSGTVRTAHRALPVAASTRSAKGSPSATAAAGTVRALAEARATGSPVPAWRPCLGRRPYHSGGARIGDIAAVTTGAWGTLPVLCSSVAAMPKCGSAGLSHGPRTCPNPPWAIGVTPSSLSVVPSPHAVPRAMGAPTLVPARRPTRRLRCLPAAIPPPLPCPRQEVGRRSQTGQPGIGEPRTADRDRSRPRRLPPAPATGPSPGLLSG
jgi:hypothetical protein